MYSGKKAQHDFPKMRGGEGGQRPFGTFPKIHPFWRCGTSLSIQFIRNVDEHAHADEDVLKEKQGGH